VHCMVVLAYATHKYSILVLWERNYLYWREISNKNEKLNESSFTVGLLKRPIFNIYKPLMEKMCARYIALNLHE
jgi:hypothetical protein